MELKLQTPNAQIETEHGTVDIWQVEDGNKVVVEIFPPNQSKESFEKSEYSNIWNMFDILAGARYHDFDNAPTDWTMDVRMDVANQVCDKILEMLGTVTNIEDFKYKTYQEKQTVLEGKINLYRRLLRLKQQPEIIDNHYGEEGERVLYIKGLYGGNYFVRTYFKNTSDECLTVSIFKIDENDEIKEFIISYEATLSGFVDYNNYVDIESDDVLDYIHYQILFNK